MQQSSRNWRTILKNTGRGIAAGIYFLVESIARIAGAITAPSDYDGYKGKKGKRWRKTALGFRMPLWLDLVLILAAIIFCITIILIYYPF